jgi:hypothetical protein
VRAQRRNARQSAALDWGGQESARRPRVRVACTRHAGRKPRRDPSAAGHAPGRGS